MFELLFSKSISASGNLIIPFQPLEIDRTSIYSYALLSELGIKGKFHKCINPAGLYHETIEGIIEIAKGHLRDNFESATEGDYFRDRYTYKNNLIIVCELGRKYFYDHYKSNSLNNIAAPKIFNSKSECIEWIKNGLTIPSNFMRIN